ncbi:MAG TPA: AprI/Inh family metalloprotease inhibitor [Bosea sp. (in: a-proteobacteria)]|jgi:hypothetical protein|uniref:AprI/Inh family metalloprotease inhibitor n=1 Tax=Bosea sp. (in: a-proteobacteria) TaxID=1871050 RepID=UPI002E12070E|nr:AprI/Inh family metalloprotease inhibitor [Bosea sp. (in: a-proteobacteria)]
MEEGLSVLPGAATHRSLLLAAGILLACHASASAQTAPLPRGADKAPPAIAPLLGAWDLEQIGASRQCTVTLGVENAANGRQLRFPATCRRALPILDDVASWNTAPDGSPRLDDALGKTLILFRQSGNAGFQGKGPDGKDYRLDPKNHPRAVSRPALRPAEAAATAAQRPTVVDPASAPAADSLPGRYAMMRQANREACRIVLGPAPAGAQTRATAAFEGNCPDTGLTIFDPVGWRYAAGRLALVARKGHSVELIFEGGQWRKDPAVGAPLLLRKLP